MSEVGFTKGPWSVRKDARNDHGVVYIAGLDIISASGEVIGCEGIAGDGATERANAHLIAAAPDLYEALECLIKITDDGFALTPISVAIQLARAALAKARGETP